MKDLEYFKRRIDDMRKRRDKAANSLSTPAGYKNVMDTVFANVKKAVEDEILEKQHENPDISDALKSTGGNILLLLKRINDHYENVERRESIRLDVMDEIIEDLISAYMETKRSQDKEKGTTRKRPAGLKEKRSKKENN